MEIYIHIPFCAHKCNYCAFYSVVGSDIVEYIEALCHEIVMRRCSESVSTVYIGGGTPSILTVAQIEQIINALHKNFDLTDCLEFTIEVNPGTVDSEYLMTLKKFGINRISIGVQSFNDSLLKLIGRIHNRDKAISIIEQSKKFFNNVNIDLMYGLPDQKLDDIHEAINMVTNFEIEHISIYGLEIEEGTPFYFMQDELHFPTEDESVDMYDYITSELPRCGYKRYEISNYAQAGFESQHNLGYWNDVKYIGLGASAHSYDGKKRQSNVANVQKYIEGIKKNRDILELEEIVTTEAAMEEFCFLALRTAAGIDMNKFKHKFGVGIDSVFGEAIKKLYRQKMIEIIDDKVRLTDYGMKLGNIAFAEFIF